MSQIVMPIERIVEKIYFIREHKMMFDQDLAELYGVETKHIVQAVKRNKERFPDDFMFQLNIEEFRNLRSQNVTSSWGGRRYAPFAFTEQGVAMLSSVLKSEQAVKVNIAIMRAFVALRKMALNYADILKKVEDMEKKYDKQFKAVFEAIKELMIPPEKNLKSKIGFLK